QVRQARELRIPRCLGRVERLGEPGLRLLEHLGRRELGAHVYCRGAEGLTDEGERKPGIVRRTSDELLPVGHLIVRPAFETHGGVVRSEACGVERRVQAVRTLTRGTRVRSLFRPQGAPVVVPATGRLASGLE